MRITTEKLLELALKESESRTGVISGYVIGSAASGEPVFGGTADVDLVLIHEYEPLTPREIVPLSDDVHLDITHHAKSLYDQPRELRIDPWIGPAVCEPVFLYDPSHFFQWAQASVRGQFHRPDYAHARGVAFLERARRSLQGLETERLWLHGWLRALLESTNAVASLDGFPAAGRRVMRQLQLKLDAIGHSEIYGSYLRLMGAENFDGASAEGWIENWVEDFQTASGLSADPELAEVRLNYHRSGFRSFIEDGSAVEILWPLLTTWDLAMHKLGEHHPRWVQVLDTLGLSIDHASQREGELELHMDRIEEILETSAEKVGA